MFLFQLLSITVIILLLFFHSACHPRSCRFTHNRTKGVVSDVVYFKNGRLTLLFT